MWNIPFGSQKGLPDGSDYDLEWADKDTRYDQALSQVAGIQVQKNPSMPMRKRISTMQTRTTLSLGSVNSKKRSKISYVFPIETIQEGSNEMQREDSAP